jgi:hypothetical protein
MTWDRLDTLLLAAILAALIWYRPRPATAGRFVIFDKDDAEYAFDTVTGRLCRTESAKPDEGVASGGEPACMNIK